MSTPPANLMTVETLVIGGGVAGLWTLDELVRHGHDAALIEAEALGHGQSICAQGILHGGVKYTLSGLLAPGARQVSRMPELWAERLEGRESPDLSGACVRASACHLWRTDSMKSILGMSGAKIALRTRPRKLPKADRPEILKACPGDVALLPEKVLETPSLLAALAAPHRDRLLHGRVRDGGFEEDGDRRVWLEVEGADGASVMVRAGTLVLCAGAGNQALLELFQAGTPGWRPTMQRRPLHMSMLKGPEQVLPELNGHCVDGAATRVTVTSSTASDGSRVWQLGGELAEQGCERDPVEQTEAARSCLREAIPGFDPDAAGLQWSSYRIDRAEIGSGGTAPVRPDDVHVDRHRELVVVWPTKMVLAPRAAEKVCGHLGDGDGAAAPPAFTNLPTPPVASPPWETAEWS